MGIAQHLCSVALRPLLTAAGAAAGVEVGGLVDQAAVALVKHFSDGGQKLPAALARAQEQAWQALEMALAGGSWWLLIQDALAGTEQAVLRRQIQVFLEQNPLPVPEGGNWDRKECLRELQEARKRGVLRPAGADNQLALDRARALARFADPATLVEVELLALRGLAADLRKLGYSQLAALLEVRTAGESSLLVAAACYFFRREIEEDPGLARGLTHSLLGQVRDAQQAQLALLDQLSKDHGRQFATLHVALQQQEQRLAGLLAHAVTALHRVEQKQDQLQATALDIRQEQRTQGRQLESIYQLILKLQGQVGVAGGALDTRSVLAGGSEELRLEVEEVLQRFRDLPAQQQQQMPAMLNAIGKLLAGTGQFPKAAQLFREASQHARDRQARAESRYNAYRALLERRKDWPAALEALREASQLDPRRFALFPLETYPPEEVIDVVPTGVTFRCRSAASTLFVKALDEDELDRPVAAVFEDLNQLWRVAQGVVRPAFSGYGNPADRTRPYLVYDDRRLGNLEKYLHGRKQGLPPERMLPLAVRLAEVLQAIHQAGLLHRDVRPVNVLVSEVGDGWKVELTGFGLALRRDQLRQARQSAAVTPRSLTAAQMARVLDYLAPEQSAAKTDAIGRSSDIYSFARVCCFALFRTPRPGRRHWKTLGMPALRRLLDECLSPDPARRPRSMDDVLRRLKAIRPRRRKRQRDERKPARPRLVVEKGVKPGVEYLLKPGANVIGRPDEQPVDVNLEGQETAERIECSRRHCCIHNDDGTLIIEDGVKGVKSTNGTFVNGAPVFPGERRRLRSGDVVQAGTVRLRVRLR
jgi:serine/threonine protein kinase